MFQSMNCGQFTQKLMQLDNAAIWKKGQTFT